MRCLFFTGPVQRVSEHGLLGLPNTTLGQSLLAQGEASDQMFPQDPGRPLWESDASL